jgi:ABC-type branched-subunit amino acid transport system ATPase component/ABC-type branched-subunit amino acid transport system permease subunit
MGIRVDRMITAAACLATFLGVIAGVTIGPSTALAANSGAQNYTMFGLIAVTVGGLGSLGGSLVGGLALGLAESLTVGYVSSTFADPIAIGVLLFLLLFRPHGLVGRRTVIRSDIAERKVGHTYVARELPRIIGRPLTLLALALVVGFPWLVNAGDLSALTISGIYCIAVVGLDACTGLAGQVNLGQSAFMAVGGYTAAVLVNETGMSADLSLVCGLAGAVVLSLFIGLGAFRLKGMYLATATLALGVLAVEVASGLGITGGANGIALPKHLSIGSFSFDSSLRFYYLVWVLAAVAALIVIRIKRSPDGLMMRVMNADEMGARALGANVRRLKLLAFMTSALFGGLAGALFGEYNLFLSPDSVSSGLSLAMITMVVVGGEGSVIGPMVAATLLTFLPLAVQSISTWATLLDGLLLVVFLRFLPSGLYGGFAAAVAGIGGALRRRRAPSDAGAPSAAAEGGLVPESVTAPVVSAEPVRYSRPGAPERVLEVVGLSKAYGGVSAVDQVSFTVRTPQIFAIIGPNGAGKSTMLNLISGCERTDGGEVRLNGRRVTGTSPEAMAGRGVVRTFQQSRFFPQLSVVQNVIVGAYSSGHVLLPLQLAGTRAARSASARDRDRADALLEIFGLSPYRDQPPTVLPLAAQKGLDLARALMSDPDLILLDEPGAGLNDAETEELGSVLVALRSLGKGIVFVDHNMGLVMSIADRVMVMDAGREICAGSPAEVRADAKVLAAYVGMTADGDPAGEPGQAIGVDS